MHLDTRTWLDRCPLVAQLAIVNARDFLHCNRFAENSKLRPRLSPLVATCHTTCVFCSTALMLGRASKGACRPVALVPVRRVALASARPPASFARRPIASSDGSESGTGTLLRLAFLRRLEQCWQVSGVCVRSACALLQMLATLIPGHVALAPHLDTLRARCCHIIDTPRSLMTSMWMIYASPLS